MSQPKYHRLALAQLSFNPAYLDESGVSYLHEPLFPADDAHGLYRLAGIPEVRDLRARIATAHVDHMSHKIRALVEFAASQKVELLVLPEYSVPHELLDECKNLSQQFAITIVAGSHIATKPALAEHARLGIDIAGSESRRGRAVCPVFLPNGQSYIFEKLHRSKWESSVVPGQQSTPIPVTLNQENVRLEVLICIDAIQEGAIRKARRSPTSPTLVAMPSLTPDTQLFCKRAELLLAAGNVTLFANIAEFGGSKAFARTERAKGWLIASDGTDPIPKHSEALVIIDADLSNQFDVRKSTSEHFPVRDAQVAPLVYTQHSEVCKDFIDLMSSIDDQPESETELHEKLNRFEMTDYRLFPRLMQDKLKHFITNVLTPGLADQTACRRWLTPVVIDTTTSTDALRWDLCSRAIEIVNDLTLSGKYPEKTDEFTDTYKNLVNKRNELRSRMEPSSSRLAPSKGSPSEEPQAIGVSIGSFEPPFFDRDPTLSALQSFINSPDKTCFVLAGMRGIGKTSIAREALKKVIPPTWKRYWIPLTEGASYPRLLAEIAHQSGLRLPGETASGSPAKQIDVAQNLLLNFSHTPRLAVVFDDFQYLLEPNGEISDENTSKFLCQLIQVANARRNKLILVTTQIPKLDAEIRQFIEPRHISGLERKYSENLYSYWFRFERDDLRGQPISYPDKLLAVLNGHPLGIKVAAKLVAERSTQQVESEAAVFRRLRETIISFFLDRVQLSDAEDELVRFASIFRLPVGRDAFVAWKADRAGFLLDSLMGRSLIETDGEEYSLHPIIRDHFYTTTPLPTLRPFHKLAGSYFLDRYKKAKTATTDANPELLGEAIHHYLCSGDREKVRSFALYKYELRPVALSHFIKRDFDLALKDYRVLIALDPTDSDAHFHLSLIYARNKSWDRAEEHFGKAIRLKPNAYWILQGYGHAKLGAGLLPEAEQLLLQSLDINPRHSPTLVDLGRLNARQGDEIGAESYFRQAIEADENSAFAFAAFARFLLKTHRYPEGLEMAIAAMETNPRDQRNRELVDELRERMQSASQAPGESDK
jgi:tetratricopeptide (TPR) repeat protein/predicted amidohydrolase